MPILITSPPRSGPTVRSSMTVSGAGSAPARSSADSTTVSSTLKLPLIWPEPPVIGSRMTGAGVGQPFAVERDAVLHRIGLAGLGVGKHGHARRQAVALGYVGDHVEGHL